MHAPLPPSSAARLIVCPGSRALCEAYPQEPTIESMEGDAAHWAAAELLRGEDVALGQVAANGVTLSDEMIDHASTYANHIKARSVGVGQVEQLCGSGALHPLNYGTPDHWEYDADSLHLYVDDFKYGHRYVSETRNWQLMNYAALIAHERGLYGDDRLKITMTIAQPRAYHRRGPIRSVTVTLGELRKPLSQLSLAFRNAMLPDARVNASDPEQCRDCSARTVCEAAIAAAYDGVDMSAESTPLVMSPAALSKEYRLLRRAEDRVKARREGIEQAILSSLKRGASVPFFGIEHSVGRRVWTPDADANGLRDFMLTYGIPVLNKYVTPLQAIAKGMPEEVVMLYSHAPPGAAGLVEDDGTLAENIFKGK